MRSPVVTEKPTSGCAIARRFTVSETAMFSARSDFKNLSRAGVAENQLPHFDPCARINGGRL